MNPAQIQPTEQPRHRHWRNQPLAIRKFLGQGRSGSCWLVEENPGHPVVLKEMHDGPNGEGKPAQKLADEIQVHRRLLSLGIPTPVLHDYDVPTHSLLKEFIDGEVASSLIANGKVPDEAIASLFAMADVASDHHCNLDYHPSNFVIRGTEIYYIDYELTPYREERNLRNWGIFLWANPVAMRQFIATGNDGASPLDSKITSVSAVREITERVRRWLLQHDQSEALFPG